MTPSERKRRIMRYIEGGKVHVMTIPARAPDPRAVTLVAACNAVERAMKPTGWRW